MTFYIDNIQSEKRIVMEINRILIDVIHINSNLFKYSKYFNELLIYEKVIKPNLKINHFKYLTKRVWAIYMHKFLMTTRLI